MVRFPFALLALTCVACSGRDAQPTNTTAGGESSLGGTSALGGAPGGQAGNGGRSGAGASGGAGAECAFASAEPGAVVPPAAISTHFVLVVDPSVDEPTNVASSRDFSADCGSTAVGGLNQTGFAAWSECVARHYVEEVNGAFASLLGSSAPMLQFGSFSVLAKPELARGRLRNELPQAIEPLAEPGGLSIFLVMDMADANGGIARRSQAYPDAFKGASVAMEAESTWQIMAHELGHAIGFSHVSGPNVEAVASYECCGGAQAATVRGDCDETSNIMCEVGGLENTFDTCEHGAFLKKIARCWLGGNGGPNCSSDACVLGDPAAVRCKNAAGGVRCTCLANSMTYSALDCNDAVSQIFTACKGPSCDPFGPNLCASGAACYPTASGDNQCAIAGSAKVGSACNRPNECAPGALCVGAADGTSKCGLLCDRVGGADPFAACPADCGEVSVLSEDLAICVP